MTVTRLARSILVGVLVLAGLILPATASRADSTSAGLTFSSDDWGTVMVTGCDGACPTNLIIPEMTDSGERVTSIGASAFQNQNIVSVSIPSSVRKIGARAFARNQLSQVVFPGWIESLGDYAFAANRLVSVKFMEAYYGDDQFIFAGLSNPQLSNHLGGGVFNFNWALTHVDVYLAIEDWTAPQGQFVSTRQYVDDHLLVVAHDGSVDSVPETPRILSTYGEWSGGYIEIARSLGMTGQSISEYQYSWDKGVTWFSCYMQSGMCFMPYYNNPDDSRYEFPVPHVCDKWEWRSACATFTLGPGKPSSSYYEVKLRAVNEYGASTPTRATPVREIYKPSSPTGLTTQPSAGAVAINFGCQHLSKIGHCQYSLDRGHSWVKIPESAFVGSMGSLKISALANGVTYTIALRSVNDFGTSRACIATFTTPVIVPNAPLITSASSGKNSVTVNFTAPTNNGGADISNYAYTVDGKVWTTLSPASTSTHLVITGLTPNKAYTLKIRAINSAGSGAMSAGKSIKTLK